MEFENKVLAKEILSVVYESGKTIGTAESCTSGTVAAAITSVSGASNYFKGGIVSYATEVKVNLLGVSQEVVDEKTEVCEEVACQMVRGAIKALNVDYAVAITGFAGPGGGTSDIPVGTIWIACGNAEEQVSLKLEGDHGREKNLAKATHDALNLFLEFLRSHEGQEINLEEATLTAE